MHRSVKSECGDVGEDVKLGLDLPSSSSLGSNPISIPEQQVVAQKPSLGERTNSDRSLRAQSFGPRLSKIRTVSGSFSAFFSKSIFKGWNGSSSNSRNSSQSHLVVGHQPNERTLHGSMPNVLQRPYREVSTRYSLGKIIGSGTYGTVYSCRDKISNELLACKSVDKTRLKSIQDIKAVKSEVQALEAVGKHPAVVTLKDVYEDLKAVHLVMELCYGGELYDKIKHKKGLPERDVAMICKKIVSVLCYCHSLGIVHRDLKPENIMLAAKDSLTDVRLVDFGHAGFISPGANLREMVGTAMFVAPEVLKQNYGCECDIWSLGMTLFVLLTGSFPFESKSDEETFRLISHGKVDFGDEKWGQVSMEARNLVSKMVLRDVSKRISAEDIEGHPWILRHCGQSTDPVRVPVFELKSS